MQKTKRLDRPFYIKPKFDGCYSFTSCFLKALVYNVQSDRTLAVENFQVLRFFPNLLPSIEYLD